MTSESSSLDLNLSEDEESRSSTLETDIVDEDAKKKTRLRRVTFCLSLSLLLSILVILLLCGGILILMLSLYKGRTDVESNETKRYQYPFLHTEDGRMKYQGVVSLPDPLEEEYVSIFADDSEVMMIFGWGEKNEFENFYEVHFHLHCCPFSHHPFEEDGTFEGCRILRANIIVNMPANSEQEVRADLIEKVTANTEIEHCEPEETLFEQVVQIEKIKEHYDCHGFCQKGNFDLFLERNPSLIDDIKQVFVLTFGDLPSDERIKKDYIKPMYEEHAADCSEFRMNGKYEANEGWSDKRMKDAYFEILKNFCEETRYLTSDVLMNKKYYGVCGAASKNYDCKPHPMNQYETVYVGQ